MPALPGRVADSWVDGGGGGGATVHNDLTGRSAASAHPQASITGLAAALAALIPSTEKGAANGVATLDAGTKIPAAQIPAIALSEFLGTVASEAAMLALVGQRGDWCIRTDLDPDSIFMLESDDPTQAANWTNITGAGVVSVDGFTGAVDLSSIYMPAASADEDAFWTLKAALLDPDALAPQTYYDTFDVTLANPLWVLNAWQTQLDARANNRFDVRVPPYLDMIPPVLPAGTRIQGLGTGSSLFGIDPTLVSYSDPKAVFMERMARLGTLEQRIANQNGAGAVDAWIDDSRAQWTSPKVRANTALFMTIGGVGLFGCTQQFSVPVQINNGANVTVSMFLQRVTGNSGDLKVDIRTNSGGDPTGTIIGTATVAAANLPALDGPAAWVDVVITLTANLTANTIYHLQGLNASGTSQVCQWRAAEGVDQTYYKGRYHNGSAWVDPTGFKHYCCAINRAALMSYLLVAASGFDTPWVITRGEMTGANMNLWSEISDVAIQRSGNGLAVPLDLRYGMRYRMNGGVSGSRGVWVALELPSDW